MWKYTAKVDGMMCGMCEAHMNDAVRRAFDVKKVNSSHSKKETVFITNEDIDDERMKAVVTELGYDFNGLTREPYEKKGFFGLFK